MNAAAAGPFRGWYVVAAGFCILFIGFGTAYSFGAFFASFSETFDAPRAAVSTVFSWTTFAIFTTGALSGAVADRIGPRPVVAFGVVAISAGFALASAAETLGQVQLGYALGVGLGVGCAYVPTVGAVQHWFVRRRGFASGLTVAGVGVGTLLVPLLAGALLDAMHWREVMRLFAGAVLLAGAAAAWWMSADPAAYGLHPDGLAEPPPVQVARARPLGDIVLSRTFVVLYAAQAVMCFGLFMPFAHIVPSAMDAGVRREQAVLALGMLGLGSTLGRFLLGSIADRWPRERSMLAVFVVLTLSYALWWRARDAASFLAFALLFGTCYGGYVALIPALLADYFAGARLGAVIGLQYTAAALTGLAGPVVAGMLYDRGGSYSPAFALAAVATLCGAALLSRLPDSRAAPEQPERTS